METCRATSSIECCTWHKLIGCDCTRVHGDLAESQGSCLWERSSVGYRDCSKYSAAQEAGFDLAALKTSLIQYFRCRSRSLLTTSAHQQLQETYDSKNRNSLQQVNGTDGVKNWNYTGRKSP